MEANAKKSTKEVVTRAQFFNSLFKGDVNTTPDLFDDLHGIKGNGEEFIIQVKVQGGTTVELKTGAFSIKAAERHVPFAMRYCEEEFGKVLAWNWKGEKVVRTPLCNNPKGYTLTDKILNFFGLSY